MLLFSRVLRLVFHWLYTIFAWAYDFVAALVSFGRWQKWVLAIIPLLKSSPILELGFGPGHLQVALAQQGAEVFGIDASQQMCRLAQKRIRKAGYLPRISRANAEDSPFPSGQFFTIVATFPAPYLFTPATANEINRLLQPGGTLVVLLSAQMNGSNLADKILHFLFRWTGQLPSDSLIKEQLIPVYDDAGFQCAIRHQESDTDNLLVLFIMKPLRR